MWWIVINTEANSWDATKKSHLKASYISATVKLKFWTKWPWLSAVPRFCSSQLWFKTSCLQAATYSCWNSSTSVHTTSSRYTHSQTHTHARDEKRETHHLIPINLSILTSIMGSQLLYQEIMDWHCRVPVRVVETMCDHWILRGVLHSMGLALSVGKYQDEVQMSHLTWSGITLIIQSPLLYKCLIFSFESRDQ